MRACGRILTYLSHMRSHFDFSYSYFILTSPSKISRFMTDIEKRKKAPGYERSNNRPPPPCQSNDRTYIDISPDEPIGIVPPKPATLVPPPRLLQLGEYVVVPRDDLLLLLLLLLLLPVPVLRAPTAHVQQRTGNVKRDAFIAVSVIGMLVVGREKIWRTFFF